MRDKISRGHLAQPGESLLVFTPPGILLRLFVLPINLTDRSYKSQPKRKYSQHPHYCSLLYGELPFRLLLGILLCCSAIVRISSPS
jgi:hypothetical protein